VVPTRRDFEQAATPIFCVALNLTRMCVFFRTTLIPVYQSMAKVASLVRVNAVPICGPSHCGGQLKTNQWTNWLVLNYNRCINPHIYSLSLKSEKVMVCAAPQRGGIAVPVQDFCRIREARWSRPPVLRTLFGDTIS